MIVLKTNNWIRFLCGNGHADIVRSSNTELNCYLCRDREKAYIFDSVVRIKCFFKDCRHSSSISWSIFLRVSPSEGKQKEQNGSFFKIFESTHSIDVITMMIISKEKRLAVSMMRTSPAGDFVNGGAPEYNSINQEPR